MIDTSVSFFDFLGLIGVAITIVGYATLQSGKVALRGWLYSFLNALGSLLILTSLVVKFNLPAFLMEAIWFLVSLYGFYKVREEQRKRQE